MKVTLSRMDSYRVPVTFKEIEALISEAKRMGATEDAKFFSIEDSLAGLFGYTVEWFK